MATSGSIDFTVTRDDIIQEALEQLGVLNEGSSPNANQITTMSRTLNMMLKFWQAEHTNLFAVQKMFVFLEKNKHEYNLSSSGDHATTNYIKTQLSADASTSATSISVNSISGISNGDNIGIQLDDGTMFWTTVNGAPSGSTITLSSGLSGAASADNYVFAYTTKANRPMKILHANILSVDNNEIPVDVITRTEYTDLPDKTTDGQITQIYYDPQIGTGKLFVWPETDTVTDVLVLWVQRTLEDLDTASDNVDYPQEWYLPIALNLAMYAANKYGVPSSTIKTIAALAVDAKNTAEAFDVEDYMLLQPDYRRSY